MNLWFSLYQVIIGEDIVLITRDNNRLVNCKFTILCFDGKLRLDTMA